MRLVDKYNLYRQTYKNYVILLKSGSFYEVFNEDTTILYQLFQYRIKKESNYFKTGFPSSKRNEILKELESKKINYVILEEDIVTYKDKNNQYKKWVLDPYKIYRNCQKLEEVFMILEKQVIEDDFYKKMDEIQSLL